MLSRNKWVVKGKVTSVIKKQRGFWVTINGVADNKSTFKSDSFRIKCWISKRVLGNKQIKNEISIVGYLHFKKQDCYLAADKIN